MCVHRHPDTRGTFHFVLFSPLLFILSLLFFSFLSFLLCVSFVLFSLFPSFSFGCAPPPHGKRCAMKREHRDGKGGKECSRFAASNAFVGVPEVKSSSFVASNAFLGVLKTRTPFLQAGERSSRPIESESRGAALDFFSSGERGRGNGSLFLVRTSSADKPTMMIPPAAPLFPLCRHGGRLWFATSSRPFLHSRSIGETWKHQTKHPNPEDNLNKKEIRSIKEI